MFRVRDAIENRQSVDSHKQQHCSELLHWLQKSCSASRAAFFSTIVPTPRRGGSNSKTPVVRSDIPLAEYTSHQGFVGVCAGAEKRKRLTDLSLVPIDQRVVDLVNLFSLTPYRSLLVILLR